MKRINIQIETRIAILYAIFGGLWILFSDSLLNELIPDLAMYARIQTYKGWLFVAASALLIYSLVKQEATKRNETLKKLRASEEALRRFELLAEHSRDIILFMRRDDGRILDVNVAAIQAYGYGRDELLALTVRDLRAPDTQPLTADQMAQADNGGILFETIHRRKDGSTFPVEVSSQGATIAGVRTLVSIVRDITERKRAEAEITSLSKFPTENPNPVLRVQYDGRLTHANPASQALLEMWGCEVHGYLPADVSKIVAEAVENGLEKTVEVPCNENIFSLMVVPILDGGYVNLYGRDITARLRAEQALFESEEKYRLIADNASDWIYWIKPDGNFRYVSPSCERITGFTPSDFLTNPCFYMEIIHPEDRILVAAHLDATNSESDTENLEFRIVTKEGEVRWISHSCAPLFSAEAEFLGRRCTNNDITASKQAEEALRESEAFTKIILDNLPVGIAVNSVDPEVTFSYMNDKFSQIYRTTKESLSNPDSFWNAVYQDSDFRKEIKKRVLEDIASGEVERMHWVDIPITRKEGETRFITARNIPVPGKSMMISTVWDNTDRKRAEDALRHTAGELDKRTRELNAILSSVQEFVYMFDLEGRFVFANQNLLNLWGMTTEQVIGKTMRDLGYPEAVEATLLEGVRHVQQTGQPVTNITHYTSPTGATGSYENILTPMFDTDGKVSFVAGSSRDITERKRAEDELIRTLEELKHSNAELEQFAYVASHDLQEPLRGIAGLSQLLQQRYQGQLDSRADEYIRHIVEGTQRMQTLINDLLAYSRIGRRGEAIQSISADVALKATLQNLNAAIQEYGATITNASLPKVRADATQLIQLFQNLIGNAIKFRSERPARIHVGVSDAGACWQFSVQDNGIGIEPQYFERIFQVFQRLHTLREYKGTGIGLAICKKIVERHGGKIWVESQVEQGSTFYFTLPKGQ